MFNKYRDLYRHEAFFLYRIKDRSELVSVLQMGELLPKLQSSLRHGSPLCPAPMCLYYSPITRITNMLIHQQRENGVCVRPLWHR